MASPSAGVEDSAGPGSGSRHEDRKYSVHGLFAMPDLIDPAVGLLTTEKRPVQTLRSVYYDAQDLRLARDGITVRHRSGDGPARWSLKLPAGAEVKDASPGGSEI